jgi:signal peptidase I
LIVVFFLGAVAIGVYRVFFVWTIRVPTGSMANTIMPGDHLVVHKLLGRGINRGDVVVFRYPDNDKEYYVARVVGLPGESIQLRGKLVYINDRVLDEQRVMVQPERNGYDPLAEISTEAKGPYRVYYTQHSYSDEPRDESGDFGVTTPFQIPIDGYFILGDNRDNSEDSRYRGAVPRDRIWGKPSIIYFSVKMPNGDEIRSERILKKVQ